MYLLDTNVLSALVKAGDGRADAQVVAWFSGVDAASCFVSALTLRALYSLSRRNCERAALPRRLKKCA